MGKDFGLSLDTKIVSDLVCFLLLVVDVLVF